MLLMFSIVGEIKLMKPSKKYETFCQIWKFCEETCFIKTLSEVQRLNLVAIYELKSKALKGILESIQTYMDFLTDLIDLGFLDLDALSSIGNLFEGNSKIYASKTDYYFIH